MASPRAGALLSNLSIDGEAGRISSGAASSASTRHTPRCAVGTGGSGEALCLTIHPQHIQAGGAPRPLRGPSPALERAGRLRELRRRAARALEHSEGREQLRAGGCKVLRTDNHLVIMRECCKHVLVRLALAEVGYVVQESESILALGRFSELPMDRSQEYETWLIVVPGGKYALQCFLHILSKGGVVRGDFEEEYSLDTLPFASGGSSSIHRARKVLWGEDGRSGPCREVAAKCLLAEHAFDVSVNHEVEMLLQARGHPNVIRLRGVFFSGPEEEGEKVIITTDYYERGCIASCIRREGAFDEAEALGLIGGVLSALAHVHGQDIVHRDLKSENILRGNDGRAVLTDFGIACSVLDVKAMQARCGTPGYAAPEIVSDGLPYGKRVDVFGAGVVLYFVLYACTPFGPANGSKTTLLQKTKACKVKFPDFSAVAPEVKDFLSVLLAKDADERPTSRLALQVAKLLRRRQPAPAAAPTGAPPPPASARAGGRGGPEDGGIAPRPPSASAPPGRRAAGRRFCPKPQREIQALRPSGLSPPDRSGENEAASARPTPRDSSEESTVARSTGGGAAPFQGRSSSLSPRNTASSSVASRTTSLVPSMGRICPAFMRRRSKALPAVEHVAPGT